MTLAATVLIPTLGREPLLRECLASLGRMEALPAEILLVDQSCCGAGAAAAAAVGVEVRVIEIEARGISHALNVGLAAVAHDNVLVTHDDCRVREDWAVVGQRLLAQHPERIHTGRVLPEGGSRAVPSTIWDPEPRLYQHRLRCDVLYPNNMALRASAALAAGGFDERFTVAAEDNDFCYRWLRDGRAIAYEPALVVWHRDWRTDKELRRMYAGYWIAQGELFAKHLSAGDRGVLPILRSNVWCGVRGAVKRKLGIRRRLPWRRHRWKGPDWTYGALTNLPRGLWSGWRRR